MCIRDSRDRAFDLAETVTVRRDHTALASIALEEDAVEVKARLVVADAEQRALDHLAQHRALHRGVASLAMVWDLREITVGHSDDAIRDLAALDPVSYTHLRAHETPEHLVCRLL